MAISVDGSIKGGALSSRFQFKEAATMLAPVRWGEEAQEEEEEKEEERRRTGANMQHKARPL